MSIDAIQKGLVKKQTVKQLRLQDFREYSKSGHQIYYVLYCEDNAGNKFELQIGQEEYEQICDCEV